jgi:hypothetical protein
MRAHGVDNQGTEPWARGTEAENIAVEFIKFRYRLLPYLYSLAWENHKTGMPLTRPLFFHDQSDPDLNGISDAFLLGPDILVAPVTEEGARQREVYLPRGRWVDFWTDSLHSGPESIVVDAPLERIPVFVRAGAVLPMQPVMDYVDATPPDTLIVHVYPGAGGLRETFTLYEDDGVSRDYEIGAYATTQLAQEQRYSAADTTLNVEIGGAEGNFAGLPESRTILGVVHLAMRPPRRVSRDSLELLPRATEKLLMAGGDGYFYDGEARLLIVKADAVTSQPLTLEIAGWRPIVADGGDGSFPRMGLGRSRPNPFSAGTTIPYTIARTGPVRLEIYSPLGTKVATLVNDTVSPGPHSTTWNGRDLLGRPSAPGVYFCRLASSGTTESGKLVLLR